MIPSTLTGVLVFLASVGPGYLYVRVIEQWRPFRERTPFREAAEIVVSGALATTVAVVLSMNIGQQTGLLSIAALATDPGQYLARHPPRAGGVIAIVLALSYGIAYATARLSPGKGAKVYPDSAWYGAFERELPDEHAIVATVELRDGRRVVGLIRSFTAEPTPVDDRELTLCAPTGGAMLASAAGGLPQPIPDQFMLLRGSEISNVSFTYRPIVAPGEV